MTTIAGTCTRLCSHRLGPYKSCGAAATHFDYGIWVCDEHEIDGSPCVWENNLDANGFCRLDHGKVSHLDSRHHIYPRPCRNPRPLPVETCALCEGSRVYEGSPCRICKGAGEYEVVTCDADMDVYLSRLAE